MPKVSILIPCFNERTTIAEIVRRVSNANLDGLDLEIIVVDDGSTDGSSLVIDELAAREPRLRVIRHSRNRGKGAALRSAQLVCRGEYIVVQDADLEYDPELYATLLAPLLDGRADAVYGSRFAGGLPRRVLLYSHQLGNRVLTTLSNLTTGFNLTDMSTGAKVFRGDLFRSIPIHCDGFSVEPEITAKLARLDCRLYEVPIDYHGRSYLAGKKIRWTDGFLMALAILRFWLTDGLEGADEGLETLQSMRSARRYNRWIMSRIAPFVGDRVLEAGAGIGNITVHLLDRELIVAVDDNAQYLERLAATFTDNPNVEVASTDLETRDGIDALSQRAFDTIICINVIEHLEQDEQVLRGFHEILELGGRAIVLAPFGRWLYGSMDRALHHHRRYSYAELKRKMESAGFTVERLTGLNRFAPLPWFFNGRVLRRRAVPALQVRVFDRVVPIVKLVDRFLPFPPLSIIAVGRKQSRR